MSKVFQVLIKWAKYVAVSALVLVVLVLVLWYLFIARTQYKAEEILDTVDAGTTIGELIAPGSEFLRVYNSAETIFGPDITFVVPGTSFVRTKTCLTLDRERDSFTFRLDDFGANQMVPDRSGTSFEDIPAEYRNRLKDCSHIELLIFSPAMVPYRCTIRIGYDGNYKLTEERSVICWD